MKQLIAEITPTLLGLLSLSLMAFLGFLSLEIKKRFSVQIEEGKKVIESVDRDALHRAFATAALVVTGKGLTGDKAIAQMTEYVLKSTPDAINNLAPTQRILRDIAQAKLEEIKLNQVVGLVPSLVDLETGSTTNLT